MKEYLQKPTSRKPNPTAYAITRILFLAVAIGGLALLIQNWIVPLKETASGHLYGDAIIFLYIMMWGAHALVTNPFTYYKAPFFFPVENAAFSTDGMELQTLVVSPIWHLWNNPSLVSNAALIFSHAFSMTCMYFGLRRILSVHAGIALALAFVGTACSDHFWHSMDHHNLAWSGIIPLVFAATWMFMDRPGRRRGVFLAVSFGAAVYLSVYFFVFACFSFGTAVVCWLIAEWKRPSRQLLTKLGLALGAGMLIAAIKIGLYYFASKGVEHGHNSLYEASGLSATFKGYLQPVLQENRFISRWYSVLPVPEKKPYSQEDGQFLGFTVIFLLFVEVGRLLITATRRQFDKLDRLSLSVLVFACIYVLVSFGPAFTVAGVSPYKVVHAGFLQFTSFFRAPARFAFVVEWLLVLSLGVLAVKCTLIRAREQWVVVVALGLLTYFEHFPREAHVFNRFARIPAVEHLNTLDPSGTQPYVSVTPEMNVYTALSTPPQWRPTVNGLIGSALGKGFDQRYHEFMEFPTSGSLAWLSSNKVPWILTTMGEVKNRAAQDDRVKRVWSDGTWDVYTLANAEGLLSQVDHYNSILAAEITEQRNKTSAIVTWPESPVLAVGGGDALARTATGISIVTTDNNNYASVFFANNGIGRLALYDSITVEYSLDIDSEHNTYLYWNTPTEPLSEYRKTSGRPSRNGDRWETVIHRRSLKPWLTDSALKVLRFDFFGFDSFKPTRITIHKVTFSRGQEEVAIPYM